MLTSGKFLVSFEVPGPLPGTTEGFCEEMNVVYRTEELNTYPRYRQALDRKNLPKNLDNQGNRENPNNQNRHRLQRQDLQADRGLHCQRRQAAPEVCDKNLFVTTQRIVIFSPVVVKPHGMDYKLKGGIFYEKKTFIRNIVVSFCFLYGDISIRLCRWN